MKARIIKSRLFSWFVVIFLLQGCATVEQPLQSNLDSASVEVKDCANWFNNLDNTIEQAGVRDAGAYRIPGFPYLRVDRFLASFREEAGKSDPAFDAWIARLKELDNEARDYELSNLPEHYLGRKNSVKAKTDTCAAQLAKADITSLAKNQLITRAEVPDDYSDMNRAIGLYPLLRIFFANGVERWHKETIELFNRGGIDNNDTYIRYAPSGVIANAREIQAIFKNAANDALGIPRFDANAKETLFQTYAPVFEIETTGDFDRIGMLAWKGGESPDVLITQPRVYQRLAFTRYHGRTLVQLVYTAWFPQRPSAGTFDILAGRLDGLVFRVTLDNQGQPLVYDTIHPCGCYHMFFPTNRVETLIAPDSNSEWAFIPRNAPVLKDTQRLALRILTRAHYLIGLHPDDGGSGTVYTFVDDNELRGLPSGIPDLTHSSFGSDGTIPGTERGERFLFWPMGVTSAGTMRQWGKHATAFLGRRHFDDADLIESRFKIRSFSH